MPVLELTKSTNILHLISMNLGLWELGLQRLEFYSIAVSGDALRCILRFDKHGERGRAKDRASVGTIMTGAPGIELTCRLQ
jgi:hypothetical protein